MIRSWAYNRFGVLMGTSSRASCPRWPSLRGNSWPMITLFSSQGDFCATAMEHSINLIIAKAVIALLRHGVDAHSIVRQAALFGTCYRDNWADGLTILTAMAN